MMYIIDGASFLIEIYVYLRKHRSKACGGRLCLVYTIVWSNLLIVDISKHCILEDIYKKCHIWNHKTDWKGTPGFLWRWMAHFKKSTNHQTARGTKSTP